MAGNATSAELTIGGILLRSPRLGKQEWNKLSWFTRWLVMVRSVVLPLTIMACAIGILSAQLDGVFYLDRAITLMIGLTFAHGTNNLLNDWVDHRKGIDHGNYFRRRYGVHVLEDDLVSGQVFLVVLCVTGCIPLLCALYLFSQIGAVVVYLTMVGAFFVVFYTWPLKHFALGEISVLLVWGPLMVAGSYFVMTGNLSSNILMFSLVYGIGPTLVIMGKHIDKYNDDMDRKVWSLPLVMGRRAARFTCLGLVAVQWCLLAAMILTQSMYWLLLFAGSVPSLLGFCQRFSCPAPLLKPDQYPEDIWPLWYSAAAFRYARDSGFLFLVAIVLALALEVGG
ncbi:MAG: prenyltransferase [Gammaproteobacteria bacterium]|jgi:1,4-dihydroxy-2-naphthoate octaprenyltransferase|nr:prenyltransferase [Gammaproteobacteria bacterium]|tara:strand:- start:320 stop:1333 length:1014 start_codon:yes stop_codon:yes gene_type:complete